MNPDMIPLRVGRQLNKLACVGLAGALALACTVITDADPSAYPHPSGGAAGAEAVGGEAGDHAASRGGAPVAGGAAESGTAGAN